MGLWNRGCLGKRSHEWEDSQKYFIHSKQIKWFPPMMWVINNEIKQFTFNLCQINKCIHTTQFFMLAPLSLVFNFTVSQWKIKMYNPCYIDTIQRYLKLRSKIFHHEQVKLNHWWFIYVLLCNIPFFNLN